MQDGNDHALWVRKGIGFWVENPRTSWLFRLPEWIKWLREPGVGAWIVDYCRFSAPWRKRTMFVCNLCLRGKSMLCTRDHEHFKLRGYSHKHRCPWTRVAQVTRIVAQALLCHRDRLRRGTSASCARQTCCRIGEAKNPGPRAARLYPREGDLAAVPLVGERTLELQQKVWYEFETWLSDQLSKDPALAALFLQKYGAFLYSEGKPLHHYRHLIALTQRKILGSKLSCWSQLHTGFRCP